MKIYKKLIAVLLIVAMLFLSSCKKEQEEHTYVIDETTVTVEKQENPTPPVAPEPPETQTTEPSPEPLPQSPEVPSPPPQVIESVNLPVLMYHHLSESGAGEYTVSIDNFKKHLEALKANGYNTVSLRQLLNYAEKGEALPENPIVISFDDGYLSNYEIAYPILAEHGMKAVIFAIGSTIGNEGADTAARITYAQAAEMSRCGIEIQSHTFDMHKRPSSETDPTRKGVSKLTAETDEQHLKALTEDFTFFITNMRENAEHEVFALSYPYGIYNENSEKAAVSSGIKMTFTSVSGISKIEKNNADSLRLIKRIAIDDCTADELIQKLTIPF